MFGMKDQVAFSLAMSTAARARATQTLVAATRSDLDEVRKLKMEAERCLDLSRKRLCVELPNDDNPSQREKDASLLLQRARHDQLQR